MEIVEICANMYEYEQYVQIYLCSKSADIVRKHAVLGMGVYNLVADMRWRLYDGVEVRVSTSLLPYSSSKYPHPHQLNHHDLVGNEFYNTHYRRILPELFSSSFSILVFGNPITYCHLIVMVDEDICIWTKIYPPPRAAKNAIFPAHSAYFNISRQKYRILMFRDKKYRILMFCDKTELYITVLQQNNVEACLRCCSLWLPLARSCSLRLPIALRICVQHPRSAHKALAQLAAALLRYNTFCCSAADIIILKSLKMVQNTM